MSREGRGYRAAAAASAGRGAARTLLAAVILVALPTVALTPLVVMRAQIQRASATSITPGLRSEWNDHVEDFAESAAAISCPQPVSIQDTTGHAPTWRDSLQSALGAFPLWVPLGLALLVAAPWWLRRALFRRREAYVAPVDNPDRFWSVQRRVRPLNHEPAFAWLPGWVRGLLTWDVVPQAAFSTFAFGLVAGRMGFQLTLALIAGVQGAAFLLFLFEHGFVRRQVGLALVRLAAWTAAPRVASFAAVSKRAQGSLGRVRGRVRVRRHVTGLTSPEQGAYRLAWFVTRTPRPLPNGDVQMIEFTLTDETGHDFDLVDAEGRTLRVEIGHAQWLARSPRARRLPAEVLQTLPPGPFSPDATVEGSERILADGDLVEVVGFLEAVVDPTDEHLPRDTPVRLVLRGSGDRPALISSL